METYREKPDTGWVQLTPRSKKRYYIRGRRVPRLVGWAAMRWILRHGTKLRS